jgi:hypothetical protein
MLLGELNKMAKGTTFHSPEVQCTILELMKQRSKFESPLRAALRNRFEDIDKKYAREVDQTIDTQKAILCEQNGDVTAIRNIEAPVILPKVEAAVVYQSSVFLQSPEVFAVVSDPEHTEASEQMSALFEEHATRGGWVSEFIKFFRAGAKYNLTALECDWSRNRAVGFKNDARQSLGVNVSNFNWQGNKITAMDMYNTFFDTRVPPSKVATEGEFAGYINRISRVRLVTVMNELADDFIQANRQKALNSKTYNNLYFVPSINSNMRNLDTQTADNIDWEVVGGLAKKAIGQGQIYEFSGSYELVTCYVRLIPSDLGMAGVAEPNTPQIWKFISVNNEVLISAKRMTNLHNYLPIVIAQTTEDNLDLQTKSLAENVAPLQSIVSGLFNSMMQARRRLVNDRAIYNPRLIDPKHLMEGSPTAKIPLRPSVSVTSDARQAYFPIPFQDSAMLNLQEMPQILQFADSVSGQNPARQGQFVKGNKTRTEYQSVLDNSNGRDQLTSMHYESRAFSIVKQILLSNVLQFQEKVDINSANQKKKIKIDPSVLRNANLVFKVSDGLTPAEKLMDSESLAVAFQTIQAVPSLAQEYRIGELFAYLMNIKGADIEEFQKSKEQLAYEQAVGQWQAIAQEYLAKGKEFKIPQPTPEQFGYDVKGQQENESSSDQA